MKVPVPGPEPLQNNEVRISEDETQVLAFFPVMIITCSRVEDRLSFMGLAAGGGVSIDLIQEEGVAASREPVEESCSPSHACW